jgi:membrane protease YdiL (CAAX protease family)
VLLIIGAALGANFLLSYVLEFFDLVRYFPDYGALEELLYSGSPVAQILAIGIIGPIAEELCMRGLVQRRMSAWLPQWAAVLISAVLFGILHMNVLQGSYATLFGVLLALLYLKYRTLWAPLVAHIAINLSSVLSGIIFTDVPEEALIQINVILTIVTVALGTICTVLLVRTRVSRPEPVEVLIPAAEAVEVSTFEDEVSSV